MAPDSGHRFARREQAFLTFCEEADYADDREAPHAEAFLAGYNAGYADGHDADYTFLRRLLRKKPAHVSRGGQPPMPRPPEDRGKPR